MMCSIHLVWIAIINVILGTATVDPRFFPLSWRSSQIELQIPKDFPPNVPIFSLRVLVPQFSAPSVNGTQEGKKVMVNCELDRNSYDTSRKRRKRETTGGKDRRRNKNKSRISNTPWGISWESSLHNQRSEPPMDAPRVRNLQQEMIDENSLGRLQRSFRVSNHNRGLFKLTLVDSMLSLVLSRALRNTDFTEVTEHYVEETIYVSNCTRDVNSDFRELHHIKLRILPRFDCDLPDETMCMLPGKEVSLHQWENRQASSLMNLPSLSIFCSRLTRKITVNMKVTDFNSKRKPEMTFEPNSNGLYAWPLDREYRSALLELTVSCAIKKNGKQLASTSVPGSLLIEDENDSPPVAIKTQDFTWKYPKHLRNTKEYSRLIGKLDDRMMIADPDLKKNNDFAVRVEGSAARYISLALTEFDVIPDACYNYSIDQAVPLQAQCTVIVPNVSFDEDLDSLPDSELSFSLIFTDLSLQSINNEARYNVNLILNSTYYHDELEKSSIIHPNDVNAQSESNITVFRSPQKFARLAQIITARNKLQLDGLEHRPQFAFSGNEENFGLGITPKQGILYISDPSTFNKVLNRRGFLEVTVQREAKFAKRFFIEWADEKCDHMNYASCARHVRRENCEDSCGIGTRSKCQWRNSTSKFRTPLYSTCSPSLDTCPDGFCDELEDMEDGSICPQDCIAANEVNDENILMNENYNPPRGIREGFGVCSCDEFCLCFPVAKNRSINYMMENPGKKTIIEGYSEQTCGSLCQTLIAVSMSGIILVVAFILCRRQKECNGKYKGQTGRTHFSTDYFDDHSSSYGSGPVHGDAHVLAIHGVNNIHHNTPRQNMNSRDIATDLTLANFSIDRKWEFPRNQLILEQTLGEGEFGKVMKAKAYGLKGKPGSSPVAVKMLKKNSAAAELADLLSEFDLLKEVSHPNVILLLGACTTKGGPIYLIMEYCKFGSLRSFLRRSRHFELENQVGATVEGSGADYHIEPKDLLGFAWQICKGMTYLTNMKLVHRDLAARNVLLAEDKVCKISDFGLTRDVYEGDLYFKRSKGRVPVKWMAMESLADHVYTHKSDVWGFGVLLWELVTLGSSPYPGVTPERLFSLLKSGYRMERPENCSDELYNVMRDCWADEPERRPTFGQLTCMFDRMIQADVEYLELRSLIVTNRVYFDDGMVDPERKDMEKSGKVSRECSPDQIKNISPRDETKLDGDSYLVAQSNSSSRVCVTRDITPPDNFRSKLVNGRIHAHNPAYSPTTEHPDMMTIPPPLEYSTLASGPDEEEDAEEFIQNAMDSDSGRAPGESCYLTEDGRRHNSSRNTSVPSSFGKPLSNMRGIHRSYSPLTPRDLEADADELIARHELLVEETSLSGLITPSPSNSGSNRVSVTSSSFKDGVTSPDVFSQNQNNKRNPVLV